MGEGGEEVGNPESEHLPTGAHRAPFARRGETLIAKMKGESPDPRIPCGLRWLAPERRAMPAMTTARTGTGSSLLLFLSFFFLPTAHAASLLLGSGSHSNHLLILFAPGQTLQYELRHDGHIQTGEQLLAAVIQATGGRSVTTPATDSEGNPVPFADQASLWDGQGLFAHFYNYGWGVFVNGFASGSLSAAADGSYASYFIYEIGGSGADFTAALVGAKDRVLADGEHDAYVLTSTHSSPGLAAWKITHGVSDLGADPDGDGMDNLLEYALRRHPGRPDATGAIVAGREQLGGTAYLTLTYRRPHDEWAAIPAGADAGYDGVGYTVETSTDLASWQADPALISQTLTPDFSGPMVTVTARVPADATGRFLRLRVHLP